MSSTMGSEETPDRILNAIAEYTPRHVEHPDSSPAAVLILVSERDGEPHVVFTERTTHVEHHKGQICFPGGACDDADDGLETTALRETFEEIGVQPNDVRIVGQLDDMVTISNFRVTPYVGMLTTQPDYPFSINDHEVAQVVEVPLAYLMDERNMELEVRQHQGRQVLVPAFTYNGHRIWGATARMLHQFIELLR
jgi:8-oxo-dGTP pyrophosphatase MutT (NUDIX family)